MESPETWNLLIASFAICDLSKPHEAWAFAVIQGLVRDEPDDRRLFVEIAREEIENDITGPGVASRIVSRLGRAGLVRRAGLKPDPCARIALERLETIEAWGGLAPSQSKALRFFRDHFAREAAYESSDPVDRLATTRPSSPKLAAKRWWKFW